MQLLKLKLLTRPEFIDNTYLDNYCQLIKNNLNTHYQKFRTNIHHIVPVSHFKSANEKVDNSRDNKVNLLYKDHIIAHYLLSMCTTGVYKYNNESAFLFMFNKCKDPVDFDLDKIQQLYEHYLQWQSLTHTGVKQSEETCKKKSVSLSGRKRTDYERERISQGHKYRSEDSKQQTANYFHNLHKGRIVVNNGTTQRMIKPCELDEFLANGFVKGTLPYSEQRIKAVADSLRGYKHTDVSKQNMSNGRKGKIFIHKEDVCIMIYPTELSKFEQEGWIIGRLKRKNE